MQNASVIAVNVIVSGTNPNLTPANSAGAPRSGASGVSGGVIGGAVGGGLALLAILAIIAYKVNPWW